MPGSLRRRALYSMCALVPGMIYVRCQLTNSRPVDEPPADVGDDSPTHFLQWHLHQHALLIGDWTDVDPAGRDAFAFVGGCF